MLTVIVKNWWLHVLRGILAILFGIVAIIWPGITLHVLVLLFGIYLILEGILALSAAFVRRKQSTYWWLLLIEGFMSLGVGFFALVWPSLTAVVLLVFIAVWAILTGIVEIMAAVQLRKVIRGEWTLGLAGFISILIGIFLIAKPLAGVVAVVWIIGLYAILFGVLLTFLGFKVRKIPQIEM